ncbi:DUF4184 family protein [Kitasatospora sp. NPDC093679]|uniref:DUF4184 family protein n=1 Tax=Kitasatospora sp. NPDC093679 TaxID=3154983 RepID=UPI00344A8AE1
MRRAGRFAVSAALGAAAHVGRDGFTHPGRFGARLLPVLDRTAVAGRPLHAVLQYGTSAVAPAVPARWLLRESRRRSTPAAAGGPLPGPVPAPGPRARWAVYGWITPAAAVGTALLGHGALRRLTAGKALARRFGRAA